MQKIGNIPHALADANGEFTEGVPPHVPATYTKAAWFNTVQRELVAIIEKYGGVLNPTNDEQIYEALHKATPLRTSAIPVARINPGLRCFPEMLTPDAAWRVDVSNDKCSIADDQAFVWRGIWEINSSDYPLSVRTFTILPNKIYHLCWSPDSGFMLNDLADKTYNPAVLAEDNIAFDSQHDHLFIARIVTTATNQATVTPLQNKALLQTIWDIVLASGILAVNDASFRSFPPIKTLSLQWARTPKAYFTGVTGFNLGSQYRAAGNTNDNAFGILATRYQASFYDYYTAGKSDDINWRFHLRAES